MNEENEYLIIRSGRVKFGLYAKDIFNVYNEIPKIRPLAKQGAMYAGIAMINDKMVCVIDFRKRLAMNNYAISENDNKRMIVFHTSMGEYLVILVDEIIGFRTILQESMVKHELKNTQMNMNLLLPMVAKGEDRSLIMIIDTTYIDKIEPIAEEDSGDLEFF
ncbi:MAG: chemotaxis protein CheW [Gammaproteobacteria bacterium]|nr:chemotaxis protein CheW [Gammaproteobacteria bacterium]